MHRHAENGGIVRRRYSSAHDQDGDGLSRGKIAFFPINLSYLWLGITREKKKKKENNELEDFFLFRFLNFENFEISIAKEVLIDKYLESNRYFYSEKIKKY